MISMEDIKEIAKLNGIGIIENPTQEELEEHSESLMLSIADIIDYRHSLCKNCTWKDNCKGIICECIICNSSNEDEDQFYAEVSNKDIASIVCTLGYIKDYFEDFCTRNKEYPCSFYVDFIELIDK